MTKKIITILLFLPLITQAQTCMLSIGVRGGGQTYLPTAAVGATGTVTISEASIDAYYPLYDVHVTDQLITGKLTPPLHATPYSHNTPILSSRGG